MTDIAIITPTLNYGGGEKQVSFLALALASRGYKVNIYCLFAGGPISDELTDKGINVRRLYGRTAAGAGLKKGALDRLRRLFVEFIAALRLLAIFMRRRPDVVHLYQNQTKMAILAARIAGVKRIIYTETALISDWFTPSQVSVMKFFWNRCDAVIALSKTMKEHLESLGLRVQKEIYLVPTMFPFSAACAGDSTAKVKRDICVGIIGRLAPEKGHEYFLQAAGSIVKTRDNIRFIVAGSGYLKDKLIEAARKMALNGYVEFTDTFKDISEIMSRIDILVLSSLTEGLPLVLLEGMAYGKPIVATNVGGVPELVINGRTGLVVAPKDPQALADAILLLADDPQKRKIFAHEAISRSKEIYSPETVIPIIESIYCGSQIGEK